MGPFCSVGESCEIVGAGGRSYAGEIIGFRGSTMLSMAADHPQGIRFGDQIMTWGARPSVRVGPELLGRVIDPTGNALDGKGAYRATHSVTIDGSAPLPLERVPTRDPLGCGIRAIDAFVTCGRGQRVGIFGGSGVGKSTLIGMMARGTAADMTVLALVGERGREVNEFLEVLGEEGLRRAVVLVSTSDQSPLLRIRAALAATAVAEYFASLGKNVLLIVDSLTRFAMAQREIGLGGRRAAHRERLHAFRPEHAGSPGGASRQLLAGQHHCLLYRADGGRRSTGPGGGYGRSLLDGHVVLDRNLAMRSHYPPISILESLSRLMSSVVSEQHLAKANALRLLMAAYARSEDLIRIGAYQKDSDPVLDNAVRNLPALNAFLQQRPDTQSKYAGGHRSPDGFAKLEVMAALAATLKTNSYPGVAIAAWMAPVITR